MDDTSNVLLAGTKALTTTAVAISGSQYATEVVVQADPDNTVGVLIGNADSQPYQLAAGDSVKLRISNVALIYAKGVSGTPSVNWLARV